METTLLSETEYSLFCQRHSCCFGEGISICPFYNGTEVRTSEGVV